jgi:hypothetical protein
MDCFQKQAVQVQELLEENQQMTMSYEERLGELSRHVEAKTEKVRTGQHFILTCCRSAKRSFEHYQRKLPTLIDMKESAWLWQRSDLEIRTRIGN